MRAIVFGGSGFIGKHLVLDLLSRGYEVTVADLRRGELPDGTRFAECDVRKPIPLDLADAPQEVYNLAALHRVPGHEDHEYFATNVTGAENVARFCSAAGVGRLCFISSISVYGPAEQPMNEDSPTKPVTAYGRSKLEAESIHREWAFEHPARRLVIARPGVIFGPGERGNFELLARALSHRTFVYPGRSDTIKACAYVSELIRSLEFALTLDRQLFLYNLCYPHPYTVREICEQFHEEWGVPLPRFTVPAHPMMAAAWFLEQLQRAGVRTGIGRTQVRKLMESTHIVPSALRREGYEIETELAQGLRRWKRGGSVARPVNALDEIRT